MLAEIQKIIYFSLVRSIYTLVNSWAGISVKHINWHWENILPLMFILCKILNFTHQECKTWKKYQFVLSQLSIEICASTLAMQKIATVFHTIQILLALLDWPTNLVFLKNRFWIYFWCAKYGCSKCKSIKIFIMRSQSSSCPIALIS